MPQLTHTITAPPLRKWGQRMTNSNYAFFCPECGAVWCRLHNTLAQGGVWRVHTAACFACGPGALTMAWYPDLTKYYPTELLAQEVLTLMKEYMK